MSLEGRVKIIENRIAFKEWSQITSTRLLFQRRSGEWQEQVREVSDHGDGAAILLYNIARRTVVLIRQFRYATYHAGHRHLMIEVPAGLLDNKMAEERIRLEVEEETGFVVHEPQKIFEAFASPGSLTEKVHLYVASYEPENRISAGGGVLDEGEDIEVLECLFEEALKLMTDGQIVDLKTIVLLQHAAIAIFSDRQGA